MAMEDRQVSETPKPNYLKYIGILLLIVGISAFLYWKRDSIQQLEKYGYFGIFLISLLINLTLVMPLPTGILTSALGAIYNPFLVGLAAGSGAALGEISGYLAGISGREVLLRRKDGPKIEQQLRKYGGPGIMLLAFIPNPAFDLVGIAAGALKIPFLRFLFWCWLGKVLKMLAFAYLGDVIPFPPGWLPSSHQDTILNSGINLIASAIF